MGKKLKYAGFFGLLAMVLPFFAGSCKHDDPVPDPVNIYVDSTIRSFLYFGEGSYWVYKSNDGLYDTVRLTDTRVDTFQYVDDNDNPVSRQEYFFFDYTSSYLHHGFKIYRGSVAATNPVIRVTILYEKYGSHILLLAPNDLNTFYYGTTGDPKDNMKIVDKATTFFEGKNRVVWTAYYSTWQAYDYEDIEIAFVEGIGMYEIRQLGASGRVWSLVDYDLKDL